VTLIRPKTHLESAIALVFDEPLREVTGSRTNLGHPVPFLMPVLHVISVLHVWLWTCYFAGGWVLRLRQVLEHSVIESRVTLFVSNLGDKAVVPV
jgi:hypothetical protein